MIFSRDLVLAQRLALARLIDRLSAESAGEQMSDFERFQLAADLSCSSRATIVPLPATRSAVLPQSPSKGGTDFDAEPELCHPTPAVWVDIAVFPGFVPAAVSPD